MTKLCLECTKRYYFNVCIQNFPGEHAPAPPPSWAWLCHAGTPSRQDQPLDTAPAGTR